MARKYLTPIDLTGLELTNFKVQNLGTNPTPYGKGHTYFNTSHNELRVYSGATWEPVGGAVGYGNTSSRPAAGNAGRVYADIQAQVLYVDNGTSWVQVGIGPSTTDTLSNKTLDAAINKGTTVFQAANGTGGSNNHISVDGTTGKLVVTSGYALDIMAADDIVINPDGHNAYISNSTTTDNIIATRGWVTDNSSNYIDSVDLNFTVGDINPQELKLADHISIESSITIGGQAISDNGLLEVQNSSGTTTFISNSDPTAYGTPYTTISGRTITPVVEGIDGLLLGTSTFGIDLNQDGNIYITPFDNTVQVIAPQFKVTDLSSVDILTVNAGDKQTFVNGDLFSVNAATGNYLARFNQADNKVQFFNSTDDLLSLEIQTGSTTAVLQAADGLDINTSLGNITLNPDGVVNINANLNVSTDVTAGGLYAGGSVNNHDGFLEITDILDAPAFEVDGAGKVTKAHGALNVVDPATNTDAIILSGDGSGNGVINGWNNNLILTSDTGNAYMNTVASGNRIITVDDLSAVSSGLQWKQAVNLFSATNVAIEATGSPVDLVGTVIDGHDPLTTADAGYRILLTGQSADAQNGIYELTLVSTELHAVRTADADAYSELIGAAVFVMEGTQYAATSWVQNNHYLTDFTGQTWAQFSGQGTYTAGNGINIDGREIEVKLDTTGDGAGLYTTVDGLAISLKGPETSGLSTVDGLHVVTGEGIQINVSNEVAIDTAVVVRKFAQTLSYITGTPTSFTVDHNLGTKDITVAIYDTTTGEEVIADITRTTNDRVVVDFAVSPTSGAYRIVVHA